MIIGLIILFSTVGLIVVSVDLKKQIELLREYREDCDLIFFQMKDLLVSETASRGEAEKP